MHPQRLSEEVLKLPQIFPVTWFGSEMKAICHGMPTLLVLIQGDLGYSLQLSNRRVSWYVSCLHRPKKVIADGSLETAYGIITLLLHRL